MSDFFAMGGYGAYVWSAYAIFFIVLLFDALLPFWQRRATLRSLNARLKREAAKKSVSSSPAGNPT
jgi:heme exporter protein D